MDQPAENLDDSSFDQYFADVSDVSDREVTPNSQQPAGTMSLSEASTSHQRDTRAGLSPEVPGSQPSAGPMSAHQQLQQAPMPAVLQNVRGQPYRFNYTGRYGFEVKVGWQHTRFYCEDCDTVFVKRNKKLPFEFNWVYCLASAMMLVRSTLVFANQKDYHNRVVTCKQTNHRGNIKKIAKHVMRSCSDFGAEGVHYCGDAKTSDSWLSVVVQFMRNNPGVCSHAYKFVCENKCASGIGRRGTFLIFTLESLELIGSVNRWDSVLCELASIGISLSSDGVVVFRHERIGEKLTREVSKYQTAVNNLPEEEENSDTDSEED